MNLETEIVATNAIDAVVEGTSPWCVIHGDNTEILPLIPNKGVAHVITDPPYDAKTHRGAATQPDLVGGKHGVSFAPLVSAELLAPQLVSLAARWAIAFCAVEQIGDYARGAAVAWVRAGIWDKIAPSPQITGDRPGQAVEAIAIMHAKGRKKWNRGGGAGIWRCLPAHGVDRPEHPTPKPVALMCSLIEDFTDPGDVVLDPFCGSGTTGVACIRLGRRFIGIEKNAKYATVAQERLAAESQGLNLRDARAGQLPMFGGAK